MPDSACRFIFLARAISARDSPRNSGFHFAFASHFAPDYLVALHLYRRDFQPSAQLDKPYVIIGAGVFAAESDAEAGRLFTSAQLQFLSLLRGRPGNFRRRSIPSMNFGRPRNVPRRSAHPLRGRRFTETFARRIEVLLKNPGRRNYRHRPDLRSYRAAALVPDRGQGISGNRREVRDLNFGGIIRSVRAGLGRR